MIMNMVMISSWRDEVVKIAGYAQVGMLDILYGAVVFEKTLCHWISEKPKELFYANFISA